MNWSDNTGYWHDGAESSILKVGVYEAHVRAESVFVYQWIVNYKDAEAGLQRVSQGQAPTAAWAQHHAEHAISAHAKRMGTDAPDLER